MKQFNFKQILPHLIAIGVFLLVSVIFCKPALEKGVVAQQSDVTAVESMKHQSDLYKEKHGVYPLWITSMFSGMPAYNIIYDGPLSPFTYINKAFQLWLPKPLNFFFLSCICFYIFCLCIRIKPYTAIFASLGFAYATYNPILVVAGHDTKLLAMAYAPALLGSILLIFDKKYAAGFLLTALFASLHLMQNHQQISFYVLLITALMTVAFLIQWTVKKELIHGAKAIGIALGAAILAVAINATLLFPVYDYAKHSKRGGQLVLDQKAVKGNKVENNKTTGLSREYAFQWSNQQTEALSFIFPSINGYGFHYSVRDEEADFFPKLSESSATRSFMTEQFGMNESQIEQNMPYFARKLYWGGKPFTTGPAYCGIVIICLFLMSLFIPGNQHRWWLLGASIFGILLSMGRYLPGFNNFLFDFLPFYNKFRTPEMALVIPQLLLPAGAAILANQLLESPGDALRRSVKKGAMAVAVLFVLGALLYVSMDYTNENKQRTNAINAAFAANDASVNQKLADINEKFEAQSDNRSYEEILYQTKGNTQLARGFMQALEKDRKAAFGKDLAQLFVFGAIAVLLIFLLAAGKINQTIFIPAISLLVLADLIPFGKNYLNEKSFASEDKYMANEFSPNTADTEILKDKNPNYRVFDLSGGDPFQDAKPSYFHKSIGGYHPAKIGIYDDLASYQLSGQPNPEVLNMLNAKYIIQRSADGKSNIALPNPDALGNAWFVKQVRFVTSPVEEMKALSTFKAKDTAVIDQQYQPQLKGIVPSDSNATIRQTQFDNEAIQYSSTTNQPHLAVFSEIYYKDWHAYIDGKEAPVIKANYVLRALVIPAGNHTIDFKFEPTVYRISYKITLISSWALFALLLLFGWFTLRKKAD